MNCFEARQEFPALWRKTVTADRRADLLAHLKGCEKCDHAFRVFALTAPVLYGEMEQPALRASRPARREFSLADRPSRFASASREASRVESMASDSCGCGDICVCDQCGVSFGANPE